MSRTEKKEKQKKKEKNKEREALKWKLIKAKELSAQQILITKALNKTLREIDNMYTKM